VKTLQALQALNRETKAEVFLVGGFVRDYLRNKKNDDLDIVVRKLPLEEIRDFLTKHGSCKMVNFHKIEGAADVSILLFRGSNDSNVAQISLPKRGLTNIPYETNSLRQDSKYRDFRINGMYLPIDFKSKKDLIDHVGGSEDITNRIIRCITTPKDCFTISPIRILRLFSLVAKTNYRIETELLKSVSVYSSSLKNVPVEAIRNEFNKILLSNKPSKLLRLMSRNDVLKYVLPELDNCVGVTQDKRYHKYDVFTHCIMTCDHSEPDLVMRIAGLLHDIGKAGTRKVIKGRVTFHKHEMLSVKLAKDFMDRLRYDGVTKEKVLHLIRMHMYHYTREYGDAAVRKFIKKVGITSENIDNLSELPLFKLRQAERLGNGLKTDPTTQRQLDFEDRIRNVFERGGGLQIKDLDIDGHIIMEAFDLKPGKDIGKILRYLLNQVQKDSTKNNRLSLIELTVKYLQK
jgi:poly(A) polymerase/tRNA nucleotidyltransferase (CCA-adding enzyme)